MYYPVAVGGPLTKIVDGILWIRARSAMLGYLNAPDEAEARMQGEAAPAQE